jgi:hypothetical protein
MRRTALRLTGLVLTSALVSSCLHSPGPGSPEASNPAPVTQIRAGTKTAKKVVELGGGARVIFADTPARGAKLVVRTLSAPPLPPDRLGLATPAELTLRNGSLGRGATLEYPIPGWASAQADTDSALEITTWSVEQQAWVPVKTSVDRTGRVIRAFIDHFSWWQPLTWDWGRIGTRVNQNVGEVLGKRAGEARCPRRQPTPGWVAAVAGVTNDAALAVRGCYEGEGDILAVELVNNRPYGQVLTYGSGVQWGWREPGKRRLETARNDLMKALIGPGGLYLPPVGRASVGIRRPSSSQPVVFRAWPTGGSLTIDVAMLVAEELIEQAGPKLAGPLIGHCGAFLAKDLPLESFKSPSATHALLSSSVVDCLKEAFLQLVRMGALDKSRVTSATSTLNALKRASLAGRLLKAYDVEWRILDLFVDTRLVGGAGSLGNGFSVAARPPAPPPSTSPPPVAPPTSPPRVRGFHISDYFYGGTWARRDRFNGIWHRRGNRPANGAYWFPNGLGVAVNCTAPGAPYSVRWANGRAETWSWWAHVTDNTWVPTAVLREGAPRNGDQGMAHCR